MSGFELVISLYYESKEERNKELLYCLEKNIENEHIKKIHILYDSNVICDGLKNLMKDNKIVFQKINARPTFNYIFDYCNKNIKGKTIVSNSDIFYDDSLKLLSNMNDNNFFSISRLEKNNGDWEPIKFENGYDNIFSQDTWIFNSPMKYQISNEMKIGTFYSDSLMNYFLKNSDYKGYNLSNYVKCFHIQDKKSTSQIITNEEKQKEWLKIHEIIKKEFCFGLKQTSIEDFNNNINENLFVIWGEYE